VEQVNLSKLPGKPIFEGKFISSAYEIKKKLLLSLEGISKQRRNEIFLFGLSFSF